MLTWYQIRNICFTAWWPTRGRRICFYGNVCVYVYIYIYIYIYSSSFWLTPTTPPTTKKNIERFQFFLIHGFRLFSLCVMCVSVWISLQVARDVLQDCLAISILTAWSSFLCGTGFGTCIVRHDGIFFWYVWLLAQYIVWVLHHETIVFAGFRNKQSLRIHSDSRSLWFQGFLRIHWYSIDSRESNVNPEIPTELDLLTWLCLALTET